MHPRLLSDLADLERAALQRDAAHRRPDREARRTAQSAGRRLDRRRTAGAPADNRPRR